MRPLVLLAALLAVLSAPARAEQRLPSCHELSRLWKTRYLAMLKPNLEWGAGPALECALSDDLLSREQKRDIVLARAAYFLDGTRWTDTSIKTAPLVRGGGISAPPNMLDWVASRVKALNYNPAKGLAAVGDSRTGTIWLTGDDFRWEDSGVGLAAQLIHEARHIGHPPYDHVDCTIPGQGGPNCDPTIAEDFDGGGSHAIALVWLSWIRDRSTWPQSVKNDAESVVADVLTRRINDRHNADRFACRYLGRYVISTKRACNPENP